MKRLALLFVLACGGPRAPAPEVVVLPEIAPLDAGVRAAATPVARDPDLLDGSEIVGDDPVGQRAPALDLAPAHGTKRAALYRDRVTLVYFWAAWCSPCADEIARLEALYKKHSQRGLAIAAVGVDEEAGEVAEFAKRYGATFPVGWHPDRSVVIRWRVQRIPSLYLVGSDGIIQKAWSGTADFDSVVEEVERLLY